MPSDPTKPLLRLDVQPAGDRRKGKKQSRKTLARRSTSEQAGRFGGAFQRLADVLAHNPEGLELRGDPFAMAPERLLVFEVDGPVQSFAGAVRRVAGLELVAEDDFETGAAGGVIAYLLMPDARALSELLSLWRHWQNGEKPERGLTPWQRLFETLKDLRVWGPSDRVTIEDRIAFAEDLAELRFGQELQVEIELVFRERDDAAERDEQQVRREVKAAGGTVQDRSRIREIEYHAILATLPAAAIQSIATLLPGGLMVLDPVLHIRPQATSFSITTSDPVQSAAATLPPPSGRAIAALLDGVPVAQHPLLAGRLNVEDMFDFEEGMLVADRRHGTAMASLVVHGDRNRGEAPLNRPVAVVPIMRWSGSEEALPADRLVVDLVYRAVMALRGDPEPLAPDVVMVNLSLGNKRRPFHGRVSPWARLLDRLAWDFGILFVVSAGNIGQRFPIPTVKTGAGLERAPALGRTTAILEALNGIAADRRIISPAETVNGLTIGAANQDAVPPGPGGAAANVDPYPAHLMANPSSRLGPGLAGAIKPDALMPGGREHIRVVASGSPGGIEVQPAGASRFFGLKVAAPSVTAEHFTNGTSAAAALATRTCHLIHDALEAANGRLFLDLPHTQRALCLKALFAHGARWPVDTAALIRRTLGPFGMGQDSKQRDNVRRFMGYGVVDASEVVACAADRATFWATGVIGKESAVLIEIPVPPSIGAQARPHELAATLAWFVPTMPGRKSYRNVRLSLLDPAELADLRVDGAPQQPAVYQGKRGTIVSRRWVGTEAPVVAQGMSVELIVQREPDPGSTLHEAVPFAVAVTLAMPGLTSLYAEVQARLAVPPRVRT